MLRGSVVVRVAKFFAALLRGEAPTWD